MDAFQKGIVRQKRLDETQSSQMNWIRSGLPSECTKRSILEKDISEKTQMSFFLCWLRLSLMSSWNGANTQGLRDSVFFQHWSCGVWLSLHIKVTLYASCATKGVWWWGRVQEFTVVFNGNPVTVAVSFWKTSRRWKLLVAPRGWNGPLRTAVLDVFPLNPFTY